MDSVMVDFSGYDQSYGVKFDDPYFEGPVSAIESVKNVDEAMPWIKSQGWTLMNSDGKVFSGWMAPYLAFVPRDSAHFFETQRIIGEMPANGTVAISRQVASDLGLVVGDSILCSITRPIDHYDEVNYTWYYTYSYLNMTFTVSQIWTQDKLESPAGYYYYDPDDDTIVILGGEYGAPVVLDMESYQYVMNSTAMAFVSGYAESPQAGYMIWIDRDEVINLGNIGGTVDDLVYIEHRLAAAGRAWNFAVYQSELVTQLQQMNPQLEAVKLLFVALSLPVIGLGAYLSVVGVDLGINSRRREVGILKSRGASNSQVFGSMFLESVFLGAIAAAAGLVLGILISRFLLNVAFAFSSGGDTSQAAPLLGDFRIATSTIELAVLFGIGLMLASSYRPFRRASKMDVAEAIHHYAPSASKVEYKPRMDIILLSLSAISIFSVVAGTEWVSDRGWSWITQIVIGVILFIGIVIFPLMPFLLSLSVIRLLTRGSRRLYAKFTWLVKPWTKELHYLVDKNIVRNPRRASNLGVIIALAIAFGLFISVTMESTIAYRQEMVKYEVGSDIKIEGYPYRDMVSGMPTFNLTELEPLDTLSGVSHVSHYERIGLTMLSGYYSSWLSTVVINASTYSATVRPSDDYFVGSGSEMLELLETNGSVIVTTSFKEQNYLEIGDRIPVEFDASHYDNNTWIPERYDFTLRLVGGVKALPGFPYDQVFVDSRTLWFLSPESFKSSYWTEGALLSLSDGADAHAVAGLAEDVFRTAGFEPSTYIMEDELEDLESGVSFGPLKDFLYMEYALSIGIMSIGVGLIIFVAVTDREHELACIMARGSSGSQMRKILMGESLSLMAIGLIVGSTVGVLTAYLFNTLSTSGGGVVEQKMVMTYVTWAMLIISVASLLFASLLATARAGRLRLAEVLRIRGG